VLEPTPALLARDERVVEPAAFLAAYADSSVKGIRLLSLLDRWVYRVDLGDRVELRQASDGAPFKVDKDMAERLALARYAGGANVREVRYHAEPTLETRDAAGGVWQVRFADTADTSLYFSGTDGQFITARNDTWRVFDFFWMLHTMDYRGRDDFNNPVVVFAATGSLWLGLSGVILLFRSFRTGNSNPLSGRRRIRP
jgi:Na+-transporting NADH:ubiquinone oxidoreductase subunit F